MSTVDNHMVIPGSLAYSSILQVAKEELAQALHSLSWHWRNLMSQWVKQNRSIIFSFFKTNELDFAGLTLILAHEMSLLTPWRSHPGTDVVVTLRSSMNALIRGCQEPDLENGLLHSTSTDFTSKFMANANRDTEIVPPVMTPFCRWCHFNVKVPEDTLRLKLS